MTIDLGMIIGDTGPTGPTGPIGPTGPTGPTGETGPGYNLVSIVSDGIAAKEDNRLLRAFLVGYSSSATSSTTKKVSTTGLYGVTRGFYPPIRGTILLVQFAQDHTTPEALFLEVPYVTTETPTEGTTRTDPIYINGAATSSSNALLWKAAATLVFAWADSYWNFIGVAGQDSTSSITNLPVFTYASEPSEIDLPMRPCYYYVKSTGGFYYCDGLA